MKTNAYQPKTGQRCTCKRGVQRDNCPNCEGTGWVIDFAAIRARNVTPDIHVENCSSIFLVRALTDAGREWMLENINENEETQHFGGALVVEHRYITDIVRGMRGDGLKVEGQ